MQDNGWLAAVIISGAALIVLAPAGGAGATGTFAKCNNASVDNADDVPQPRDAAGMLDNPVTYDRAVSQTIPTYPTP